MIIGNNVLHWGELYGHQIHKEAFYLLFLQVDSAYTKQVVLINTDAVPSKRLVS